MNEENKNLKSEAALREERVLNFWKEKNIFEKSTEARVGNKEFVFYEGPPTANGKPGIHHLAARAFKDAIPRYKTMRGYHVRRKGGWDTHGLPVELQVEKKLGLNSKKAIEEYGIAKFNKECKESVWEYLDVWNKFTKRIGYWVDQENPYITYSNNFIESVWNVIKKTNEQGLLYKDYKVVPWCPRCGTALSSHELAQGYEDVKDLSVYVKFKVKNPKRHGLPENTYVLAWTTTPWTLPGNVALAIGLKVEYELYRKDSEYFLVAKQRADFVTPATEGYFLENQFLGAVLIGLEYEPLFPFLADTISDSEKPKLEKAYKVYAADFVNTEDGTGIVHTAVMYGQDDFVLGTQVGLPKHHLVNLEGKFVKGTGFLEGRFVKEKDDNGKPTLAVDIIDYLTKKNLFFKKENYEHSYPHCWRCKTALIYYARDSWYVRMSEPNIKGKLISENKDINWEPSHIREGRFGEWLREIKDWAISRERYWGTPLPVWEAVGSSEKLVVGSLSDLKKYTKKSGNKYFMLRHGESEKNVKNISNSTNTNPSPLTPRGIERVKKSAELLKNEKLDYIFASPLLRTQQTSKIVAEMVGISEEKIITDERLTEIHTGEFDGKPVAEYDNFFSSIEERFVKAPKGGETLTAVKQRVGNFIYETEEKFQNKNILIVSHEDVIWMLESVSSGLTVQESLYPTEKEYIKMGELRTLNFMPIPCNQSYELDLHKPFIDNVVLEKDGKEFKRTKEVLDVWLDSGCMPFAQDHYPFENKEWIEGKGYPADYICEAIDQTRGWFYTLHAVGVLMGRGKAYKNVICLGHLLDAKGKKMSKSLGNVVEPFEAMDKYGVDTLRLWMYGVNQPGESKNFDEKTVMLLHQQVFGLLYNVLAFYELYRDKSLENNNYPKSNNILDKWILAKLDELIELMTNNLDGYKLLEPTRAMRDFIGDLSTWYLRRSRERIKDGDKEAKATLYYVLKTISKLMAPLAPFAAEDIWQGLRNEVDKESVHLENWPTKTILGKVKFVFTKGGMKKVIIDMKTVREIVSMGLKERQIKNLPVKQPLSKIKIKISIPKKFTAIVKEELNVKEMEEDKGQKEELVLDANLTPALKEEGDYRELVRALQDMRKKMGLTTNDTIMLWLGTDDAGRKLVQKFESDMKKTVLISTLDFKENNGEEVKIGTLVFKVKIAKI